MYKFSYVLYCQFRNNFKNRYLNCFNCLVQMLIIEKITSQSNFYENLNVDRKIYFKFLIKKISIELQGFDEKTHQ